MDVTRRHNDVNHEYRIRPSQREKSNTIPTSQLSAIISRRTYNQWRDLTPESVISRTEGEPKDDCESPQLRLHPSESSKVHRLQLACTPTTLATSRKLGGQQHQRRFEQFQQSRSREFNIGQVQ